jgi:Ca-activated chloride channel family protein
MTFASPHAFWLLLVIPLVMIWHLRSRRTPHLVFSSTAIASRAGRSVRQRLMWIPFVLRLMVLMLFIIALARPREGTERVRDLSKGIAIEMVVDRSGSMEETMNYKGERLSRLDTVKRVFVEFVNGNDDNLDGRPNDLIGMIAFALYPDTVCPLTLAHDALAELLSDIRPVGRTAENRTAIGDAIALAAARLKTAEETIASQTGEQSDKYEIKSKIIILLTDGENNAGERTPMQAATLAAKWDIKIYAIGIGEGAVRRSFFGRSSPRTDWSQIRAIAQETGGMFREAKDAKALQAVYREINELEKSEVESVRYMDYKEKFVPYALAGLILLVLETALRCTIFRRTP